MEIEVSDDQNWGQLTNQEKQDILRGQATLGRGHRTHSYLHWKRWAALAYNCVVRVLGV